MIRRPPRSTRTDTLFPYTTLFRSVRDFRFDVGDPLNPCTPSSTCVPFDPIYLTQAGRDQLLAGAPPGGGGEFRFLRSEEHTSELQSLMRISYAVFCLKKKTDNQIPYQSISTLHTTVPRSTFP